MPWPRVGIFDIVGAGDSDWLTLTLRCHGFKSASYIKNPPPEGLVEGQRVLDLCKEHDYVILQNWAPPGFVKRLQEQGSKVLLWVDFESVQGGEPWEEPKKRVWHYVSKFCLLRSPTLSKYKNNLIDIYEGAGGLTQTRKPHAFAVDVQAPTYVQSFVQVLYGALTGYGLWGVVDGLFFDCMYGRPGYRYFGTATNAPPAVDMVAYEKAWQELIATCKKIGIREVWGNCGVTVNCYPGLSVKLDERFFSTHPVNTVALVDKIIQHMDMNPYTRLCLHFLRENTDWAEGGDMKWFEFDTALGERARSRMMLCTARTTFWYTNPVVTRENDT